jgi:hypothetical protein
VTALGLILALRRHQRLGATVPTAFVLASSVLHMRSRFETPWSLWPRVTLAVAIDSAHLTAYFAGRLAGFADLRPARAHDRVSTAQHHGGTSGSAMTNFRPDATPVPAADGA